MRQGGMMGMKAFGLSALPKFTAVTTDEPTYTHDDNNYDMVGNFDDGGHYTADDAMDVSSPQGDATEEPVVSQENEESVPAVAVKEEPSAQKLSLTKTTKKIQLIDPPTNTSNAFASPAGRVKEESALPALKSVEMPAFGDFQSTPSSESSGNKIDPKTWIRHSTVGEGEQNETGEDYVDMFYIDACENNGLIYVFGRIPIYENNSTTFKRTVSACAIIHGCEKNLFVLPRAIPGQFSEDGVTPKRYGITDVYSEVNKFMTTKVLPRQSGASFKCKTVKRKYAFDQVDVPRENTDYLKVVYSAKYPSPPAKDCEEGGKFYERIFGYNSSALELFLLKRKLKGPSWIRISKPKVNPDQVSWCKLEFAVEDPKLIKNVSDAPSSPTLTSMCVSIKTAVNPSSHVHEIIAIAGLLHLKVEPDADTPGNQSMMKPFCFVRQLGLSCGSSYPAQFPHDIDQEKKKNQDIRLETFPNERALISRFFSLVQIEDPDIFASHNLFGFEFDVILSRAVANKINNWSLFGRLRKTKPPKSINDRDAAPGRVLCDTYKAAKEFLRETTYSLTHLTGSQLKAERIEIDPVDVPRYFSSAGTIMQLARHTFMDAFFVQGLMLKLQVVPLTKQLTNISGNLWPRTIRGQRAERIEYLLLHEFHAAKYVLPERKFPSDQGGKNKKAMEGEDDEDDDVGGKVGGMSRKRAKAAYSGGLVLEPKKGLYDTYILLLDFNSLYPSIIQEYNLCFTTVNWPKYMENAAANAAANNAKGKAVAVKQEGGESGEESDGPEDIDENGDIVKPVSNAPSLPPLPDASQQGGILPRVIKGLVDRRKTVKNLLKTAKDATEYQLYDIRQKALKLTANSMYGCLGFSFSRFYARPIAALVTAMGREALQRTVDFATNQMSLNVIYGDTDSVMINTSLNDLQQVKEIGNKVKREVNKLYKSLELDLDGIFRSMLLLKKKKYAALVVNEKSDGTVTYEKEMKGLDLVRRDWCPLSKDTGKFVVDQILSGKPCEEIVMTIHDHLSDLATKVRTGAIDLDQFVVTKGLNKNPKDYPDCSGQAHLQVALQMIKANKPVNIGDHIPYVICTEPAGAPPAQRAHHPDDLRRSTQEGEFKIDYEWYLSNQILPPVSRLCEPIEGTSQVILSEKLGLDASKYRNTAGNDELLEDGWGFTPTCLLDDRERFKDCIKFTVKCQSCQEVTHRSYKYVVKSITYCFLLCFADRLWSLKV
jgi:DNA polymerase alpha subunit A